MQDDEYIAATGELRPSGSDNGERALATISICDLNRAQLCRERYRLFRRTTLLLTRCLDHEGLRQEFDVLLHPTAEHKLAIRSALPVALAKEDRRMYHAAD